MVAFTVMLLGLAAGPAPSEADVVAYGQRLDVKRIDSRLRSEPLQSWVERTLGRSGTVTWSSDDCAEGGGDSAPLCITAETRLRPRGRVVLSVAVGSVQSGLGGKPALFFGAIEGLGPTEPLETGDLPLLTSKLRAARALDAELSQLPDVPIEDDTWIRHVQQIPAARLVPGVSGETTFRDWIRARGRGSASVKWSVEGCGPAGNPRRLEMMGVTEDEDEWAFVNVKLEEPGASVLVHVRIGTCRKGIAGKAVASPASLYDRRDPAHGHIDRVSLEVLDARLADIRAHP
jgi:hypothetical protein